MQLILDALDFPDSLIELTAARPPSWGVQFFGGAQVFGDAEKAAIFAGAVERMRQPYPSSRNLRISAVKRQAINAP